MAPPWALSPTGLRDDVDDPPVRLMWGVFGHAAEIFVAAWVVATRRLPLLSLPSFSFVEAPPVGHLGSLVKITGSSRLTSIITGLG